MKNIFLALAVSISIAGCYAPNTESNQVPPQDSINLDSLKLALDSIKGDSAPIEYIFEND